MQHIGILTADFSGQNIFCILAQNIDKTVKYCLIYHTILTLHWLYRRNVLELLFVNVE